jgi:hypothetical protein
MFAINKKLWEAGSKFLDSAEALLKQYGGDYIFGS